MPEDRSGGSDSGSARRDEGAFRTSRIAVLAQLAEVVTAAAVVVTLVYVGRQLRATTAAIQGSSVQEATLSSSQSLLYVATDTSLARIMRVGAERPGRLTAAEAYRREVFMRQFWLIAQNVYLQRELGTLDPRAWGVYERIICDVRSRPGGRTSWSVHRHLMDEGFTALVESCP